MIDWNFEIDNRVALSEDDIIRNALINLRNNLKIEMENQEVSRSVRNYEEELLVAVGMIEKYLSPPKTD